MVPRRRPRSRPSSTSEQPAPQTAPLIKSRTRKGREIDTSTPLRRSTRKRKGRQTWFKRKRRGPQAYGSHYISQEELTRVKIPRSGLRLGTDYIDPVSTRTRSHQSIKVERGKFFQLGISNFEPVRKRSRNRTLSGSSTDGQHSNPFADVKPLEELEDPLPEEKEIVNNGSRPASATGPSRRRAWRERAENSADEDTDDEFSRSPSKRRRLRPQDVSASDSDSSGSDSDDSSASSSSSASYSGSPRRPQQREENVREKKVETGSPSASPTLAPAVGLTQPKEEGAERLRGESDVEEFDSKSESESDDEVPNNTSSGQIDKSSPVKAKEAGTTSEPPGSTPSHDSTSVLHDSGQTLVVEQNTKSPNVDVHKDPSPEVNVISVDSSPSPPHLLRGPANTGSASETGLSGSMIESSPQPRAPEIAMATAGVQPMPQMIQQPFGSVKSSPSLAPHPSLSPATALTAATHPQSLPVSFPRNQLPMGQNLAHPQLPQSASVPSILQHQGKSASMPPRDIIPPNVAPSLSSPSFQTQPSMLGAPSAAVSQTSPLSQITAAFNQQIQQLHQQQQQRQQQLHQSNMGPTTVLQYMNFLQAHKQNMMSPSQSSYNSLGMFPLLYRPQNPMGGATGTGPGALPRLNPFTSSYWSGGAQNLLGGLQQAAAMSGATQASQSLPNLTSLSNPATQQVANQPSSFLPKLTAAPQLHLPQTQGPPSAATGASATNVPPSTSS